MSGLSFRQRRLRVASEVNRRAGRISRRLPGRTSSRSWLLIPAIGLTIGILGAVAFGYQSPDPLRFAGTSAMVGAAALLTGALFGFLFGIPRMRATRDLPYAANTNLEQ